MDPAIITPERIARVDQAREAWIRRLIDLSRRNNLLYFRDLKVGTLDLIGYDAITMEELLGGRSTTLRRMLPTVTDETRTSARIQEIRRRALANLEEKGLDTLFIALGMATWHPLDEGSPPQAAVLMLPISIEAKGHDAMSFTIRRSGDIQVNLVLLHVLEAELNCKVSPECLLEDIDETEVSIELIQRAYGKLASAASSVKGFKIELRAVMGNFSYQKMAMVQDLRQHGDEMAASNIIAAIAGDIFAREAIRGGDFNVDPRELDAISPDNEFLIRNADSSQQCAISAVDGGQNLVIHGPPGTGKSQTIANLIAVLAAQGRSVLFVAEKRAALEVVLKRLEESGLEYLALDLHGADLTKRIVMSRIAKTLSKVRESVPVHSAEIHERFDDRRARLNEHVERLHRKRTPSELSVYELQGQVLRLPAEACAVTRWRGQELLALSAEKSQEIQDLLSEASVHHDLILETNPSPWTGANLQTGEEAQQALDIASHLHLEVWPDFLQALADGLQAAGLPNPETFQDARALALLVVEVAATLSSYDNDLFQEDLASVVRALEPAAHGIMASTFARIFDSKFRNALKTAQGLRRDKAISPKNTYGEMSAAADQLQRWQSCTGNNSTPLYVDGAETIRERLLVSDSKWALLSAKLRTFDAGKMQLDEWARLLSALTSDTATPIRIPRVLALEKEIKSLGGARILAEIKKEKPGPDLWPAKFKHAWLMSCLDRAPLDEPALAGFHGRSHEKVVNEFVQLDMERLQIASARVMRAHGERVIAVMNQHPDQTDIVQREANKRTRLLPLRKLLAQAPDVLTSLCPCWMASPLAVSQLLDAGNCCFDVVMFDEASQVLPEDAAPSLLRASQVVVAGDRHQLPPTMFFAAGELEDDDGDASPSEGFESLLDLMTAIVDQSSLEWHYRSKDERLIAFSNKHIYNDRLVTFPGPGGPPTISHVLVNQLFSEDGQEESSSDEVRRVVELVLDHATNRPYETLGVIAMGIRHANRVEAAIDEALRTRPELESFFDPTREERFFVKNLERVQGDERDAIILTVGYGKDRTGRLPYRFGPLLTDGGERRLNVAVTRARSRMTVVSCFSHHDMDPSRSTKRGVELLRLYLQYTASNGAIHGDTQRSNIPLNAFEADVFDELTARGLNLMPQWGASRYRIDMIAQHSTRPGRFVLAIECDGASYHSAPTARDRDRLRQQHLEALGWRFHRIWSTDWFMRREEEISRTVQAFEAAVKYSDRVDAQESAQSHAEPDTSPSEASNPGTPVTKTPRRKGQSPFILRGYPIDYYSQTQLVELVNWICSDGRLRTDDEILDEMVSQLGYQRRGPRIKVVIMAAVRAAKRQ